MPDTVSHYMIKKPISIPLDLSLEDIMKTMDNSKLSHLLVRDDKNKLMGIISKEDIFNRIRSLGNETSGKTYTAIISSSVKASEIMSQDIITVKPNDSVEYAVELLLQKEFHCIPVVENGEPIGILTFYDLLKGYYQKFG